MDFVGGSFGVSTLGGDDFVMLAEPPLLRYGKQVHVAEVFELSGEPPSFSIGGFSKGFGRFPSVLKCRSPLVEDLRFGSLVGFFSAGELLSQRSSFGCGFGKFSSYVTTLLSKLGTLLGNAEL